MNEIERLEFLGEGNIEANNVLLPPLNVKKQGNQKLKYDFVWNNYNSNEIERLERFLRVFTKKAVFQQEPGDGTPHLQGAIWLKRKARITELCKMKEFKGFSFRECRSWKSLTRYCQLTMDEKAGGRLSDAPLPFRHNVRKNKKPIVILKEDQLFDWQLEIIKIIDSEADNRSIHWYWEPVGNVGKSVFCKYLKVKHNILILCGKAADMKHGIVTYIEKHGDYPEVICLDIPRTSERFLSYGGIEQIKNGLFFSTKYESDMVVGNCPHLICFANFEPDLANMSKDRWKIRLIGDKEIEDELSDVEFVEDF